MGYPSGELTPKKWLMADAGTRQVVRPVCPASALITGRSGLAVRNREHSDRDDDTDDAVHKRAGQQKAIDQEHRKHAGGEAGRQFSNLPPSHASSRDARRVTPDGASKIRCYTLGPPLADPRDARKTKTPSR